MIFMEVGLLKKLWVYLKVCLVCVGGDVYEWMFKRVV